MNPTMIFKVQLVFLLVLLGHEFTDASLEIFEICATVEGDELYINIIDFYEYNVYMNDPVQRPIFVGTKLVYGYINESRKLNIGSNKIPFKPSIIGNSIVFH
ncbi:unnamed protein product [Gordionus sp. m RMFG-2023]